MDLRKIAVLYIWLRPDGVEDKSLIFLRHEGGVDVYWNEPTKTEVYIGRTGDKRAY